MQGVKTMVPSRKTAKWWKFIGFCRCKIGYGFEEGGLRSSTAIHAADKSMPILMFVEKVSKWALKLHSKLAFENNKILRFQNRAVAACFTTIF